MGWAALVSMQNSNLMMGPKSTCFIECIPVGFDNLDKVIFNVGCHDLTDFQIGE